MGASVSVGENPPLPPLVDLDEDETELRLSVYKITKMGLHQMGGYHTGIVIRSGGEKGPGREFAFARGGVYEVPRPENDPDPDYSFYKRVPLGKFKMKSGQSNVVETNLLHIVQEWSKTPYEMTEHNCNHFTSDVCWRLLGRPNPAWVNHLSDSIEKRQRRNDVMRAGSDALEGWLDRLLAAAATAAPQPVQRPANEPQLTQEPPQAREQPQQAHKQRWEQDPAHEHIATQEHVATKEHGKTTQEHVATQEHAHQQRQQRKEPSCSMTTTADATKIELRRHCLSVLAERFRPDFEAYEAAADESTPLRERVTALDEAYAVAAQSGAFPEAAHETMRGFDRDAEVRVAETALWREATQHATGSAQRAVAVALDDLISGRAGILDGGKGVGRESRTNGTTGDGNAQHTASMSTSTTVAATDSLRELATSVVNALVLDAGAD